MQFLWFRSLDESLFSSSESNFLGRYLLLGVANFFVLSAFCAGVGAVVCAAAVESGLTVRRTLIVLLP